MANTYVTAPLPPGSLSICLKALQVIADVLRGNKIEIEDNEMSGKGRQSSFQENKNEFENKKEKENENESVTLKGTRAEGAKMNSKSDIPIGGISRAISKHPFGVKKIITLDDLLPLFVPDRTGVLHSSVTLTVDDAPWISSAPSQRNSTLKFVHSEVRTSDALLMGAKSLRGQLFSGDDIICPLPMKVKDVITHDGVNEVLRDLIALADSLDATSVQLLFDQRSHPVESLMHPGLGSTQGPSLVVYISGPSLCAESICDLLKPPIVLGPLLEENVRRNLGGIESGPGVEEMNISRELKQYPRTGGKKLTSTFAITDCLQVATGKEYMIFDPCGSHLLSESKGPSSQSNSRSGSVGDISDVSHGRGQKGELERGPGQGQGYSRGGDENGQSASGAWSVSEGHHRKVGSTARAPKHPESNSQIPVQSPRAQRCFLLTSQRTAARTSHEEAVLTRFPDQFYPLISLPFGMGDELSEKGRFDGILIRMVGL